MAVMAERHSSSNMGRGRARAGGRRGRGGARGARGGRGGRREKESSLKSGSK